MSSARTARPISITFVTYTLRAFGGVERATTLVASGLAGRGHHVTVVSLWGEGSAFPLHPAVRLHKLPSNAASFRKRYFAGLLELRAYLRRHRPQVVVGAETSIMLLVLPAAAGLRCARVGWEHFTFGTDLKREGTRLNRWQFGRWLTARLAQAVVVLTRRDAGAWRSGLPGLRARIRVIANPLPFPRPSGNPYDPQRRVVLAVGRFTRQKGFDLLLEAWEQIEADFPGWTLRIVGTGEEEQALKAQALRLSLTRVEFTGAVSDMPAQYEEAGVYCLSSRHEGLPMVLIESQAYGVPVVAFDCETGPRELIEHGANGLLVPPEDTAALAEGLRRVMADPELRAHMSERSYQAAARFEPERIVATWEELLGTLDRRGTPQGRKLGAARRGG